MNYDLCQEAGHTGKQVKSCQEKEGGWPNRAGSFSDIWFSSIILKWKYFFFNNMASSSQFLNFFLGSFLCDCFSSIICISSLSICLKFDFCPHCHKALALGEVARNPFLAQLHQTLVTTFPLLSPSALGIGETPLRFPPYSIPPLSFNVPFSSSYPLAGDLPSCGP